MLLRAVVAGLLLAVALPPAGGQAGPEAPRHEVGASLLAYHPWPDPSGDPFGVEAAPNTTLDRMALVYDAYWFPTVRVDGVLEHAQAKGDEGGSADAFEAAYRRLLDERLAEDAPLVIALSGALGATEGNATARFVPRVDVDSERVTLNLVVFEDDVRYKGENGVDVHRFTVRAVLPVEVASLRAGAPVTVARSFPLEASWVRDRLGVVAFAQNEDARSPNWAPLEVLQSATFLYGQDGPTVQARKAPLLEMYTATWCPPCVNGDAAFDRIARAYGTGAVAVEERATYYRAPSALQAGAAIGAAALLAVALWPRARREG